MSHRFCRALCATLLLAIGLPVIASAKHAPRDRTPLVWRGDVATSNALMDGLAKAWHRAGHGRIEVKSLSTVSGLDAALAGKADFAGSVRPAFAKRKAESTLTFVPVAWDALVMITNPKLRVDNVTLAELRDIYYGRIKNWKALGGPDHKIHLYSVAGPLDGIEYSLREYLYRRGNQPVVSPRLYLNTNQLEQAIGRDPWALGVTTLSSALGNRKLHMLAVEGVKPSLAHVADGSYPLYTPLYLVLPPAGTHAKTVAAFMEFLGSAAAQKVMKAQHVLPYDPTAPMALAMGKHMVAMQDLAHPPMNGPVAAPGATYAAGAAAAPTSMRTAAARARMQAERDRQRKAAAAKKSAPKPGTESATN